jgi:hypothetical protein
MVVHDIFLSFQNVDYYTSGSIATIEMIMV